MKNYIIGASLLTIIAVCYAEDPNYCANAHPGYNCVGQCYNNGQYACASSNCTDNQTCSSGCNNGTSVYADCKNKS